MAYLDPKPYPVEKRWSDQSEGKAKWSADELVAHDDALWEKLKKQSDKLKDDEVVGGLVTFPAGDGKAIYVVTKEKPLTLQHVPLGDAYRISMPHIRGIRKKDIREMLGHSKKLGAVFKPMKIKKG